MAVRLWHYYISERMPAALSAEGWARLVAESEGLAGGDILNIVINAASIALEREGPQCTIVLGDFLAEMEASKRAKRKIGVAPAL